MAYEKIPPAPLQKVKQKIKEENRERGYGLKIIDNQEVIISELEGRSCFYFHPEMDLPVKNKFINRATLSCQSDCTIRLNSIEVSDFYAWDINIDTDKLSFTMRLDECDLLSVEELTARLDSEAMKDLIEELEYLDDLSTRAHDTKQQLINLFCLSERSKYNYLGVIGGDNKLSKVGEILLKKDT